MSGIENKVVFAIAPPVPPHNQPTIAVGIPAAAWEYMKDGKTHHFDLSSLGLPIQFVLFGAADHDAAIKFLQDGAKANGHAVDDRRNRDFSIKGAK